MGASVKFAVSLPREEFARVERIRRRGRLSRSGAVRVALRAWLDRETEADLVRRYVEGYRIHPESAEEIRSLGRMAVGILRSQEWT